MHRASPADVHASASRTTHKHIILHALSGWADRLTKNATRPAIQQTTSVHMRNMAQWRKAPAKLSRASFCSARDGMDLRTSSFATSCLTSMSSSGPPADPTRCSGFSWHGESLTSARIVHYTRSIVVMMSCTPALPAFITHYTHRYVAIPHRSYAMPDRLFAFIRRRG